MSKILKPYTIIPANLYVSRDADRQIENIIEDMGRPGYVLVSRQMGKTNLLLNAKRKLESPNDIFVYIDLSNPFDSARACFENIINTALEINEDAFENVTKDILERRKVLVDTPPHKQHTNELRLLLKQISGKLVIILDEIDALTKTHYSDQIFAQIRSIYFSRVNFTELERLTYILSGVVEPNDIIKDPKISPFNIGQKIFLNDFSKPEFLNFLMLAKLDLPEKIQERIYYWTNGNPRITWDLCSDVENLLSSGVTLAESNVDKIVSDHYLKLYDKPPIDNIRELVKQDKEIRSAIIDIQKGQNHISDKLKNKLYLAGIINYNDHAIEIKNRIINESLNPDWLISLEQEEKGQLKMAVESYSKEDFKGSLELFERYLLENNFDESENKSGYYFMMGFSAYKASDFEKAITYLNLTKHDVSDEPKNYYDTILLKAICFTYLEQYEEAHYNYKLIIDSGRRDEGYIKALINYGSVLLKVKKEELLDEALEIFIAIGNDIDSESLKIKKSSIPEIKSIAYYNTGVIYRKKGDEEVAALYFERAMTMALPETKPVMALALVENIVDDERKFSLLKDIVSQIVFDELTVTEFDPEVPLKFSSNELRELTILVFLKFKESLFVQLIEPLERIFKNGIGEILMTMGLEQIGAHRWEDAHEIFSELSEERNVETYKLTSNNQYDALKYACYFARTDGLITNYLLFAEKFKLRNTAPDGIEIEIFAILISMVNAEKRYADALEYNAIIMRSRTIDLGNKLNYLVLDHLELNSYAGLNDNKSRLNKAREILKTITDGSLTGDTSNLIGESGVEIIRKNAMDTIVALQTKTPVVITQKFARNDMVRVRYKDGVTIETKYKKVEQDLRRGECIILQ